MKSLFLSAFLLFNIIITAQELPTVIPPNPEAVSIAKFNEIPVSKFTGTADVSVPIYTINERGVKIPITLKYHTRGIKVSEVSPRVGIGWALMYGGAISRQIRGNADESRFGYFNNMELFDDFLNDHSKRSQIFNNEINHGFDFYPDKFIFNLFTGNSGSFIYDYNDNKPLLQQYSDIKIETIYGDSRANNGFEISGFIITDDGGNVFYFGLSSDKTRSAISFERTLLNNSIVNGNVVSNDVSEEYFPSSWQLMEVKLANGGLIEYIYPEVPEISRYYNRAGDEVINTGYKNNYTLTESNQYHLNEILFSTGKVKFISSEVEREDLDNAYSLNTIIIEDNEENIIQSFDLSYNYSNGDSSNQLDHLLFLDSKAKKRMMLTELRELNSRRTDSLPPYLFSYNSVSLPSRYSTSQDLWGYYNGADNGSSLLLFNENNTNDDVRANSHFLAAGTLNQIKSPTGGVTKFHYEQNIVSTDYVPAQIYYSDPNEVETRSTNIFKSDFEYSNQNGYSILEYDLTPFGSNSIDFIHFYCSPLLINNNDNCNPEYENCDHLVDDLPNGGECLFRLRLSYDGVNFFIVSPGARIPFTRDVNKIYFQLTGLGGADENGELYHRKDIYDFAIGIEYTVSSNETSSYELYGGGHRIKKIEYFDNNILKNYRTYSYSDEGGATGQLLGLPPYLLKTVDNSSDIPFVFLFRYGNHSGSYLSEPQGNAIGYEKVIEYFGRENNNEGKIVYEYLTTADSGTGYKYPYNIPNDHDWIRGKLLKEEVFKATEDTQTNSISYESVKKIEYEYVFSNHDSYGHLFSADTYYPINENLNLSEDYYYNKNRTSFRLPFVKFILAGDIRRGGTSSILMDNDIHEALYEKNSSGDYIIPDWEVYYKTFQLTGGTLDLKKVIETNYYNTDELVLYKEYNYDYVNHYKLKEEKIKIFKNNLESQYKTTNYYPTDIYTGLNNGQNVINSNLLALNRFELVAQTVEKNDELISTKLYNFDNYGDELILPSTIQTSKGIQVLEDRIVYHSYDESGNPQEVSKVDGPKIYYIWGYDKTQPIAKIEGYSDNDISSASTIIQECIIASNNDVNQVSENALRTKLSDLRIALSNAQVSTYTYDPLIGVTSITDPRGETIYYEYDEFNRLKFVKDSQENILKQHQYNYKNE